MPSLHTQIHHPTHLATLSTPQVHSNSNYRFLFPHTPLPFHSWSQGAHPFSPHHTSPSSVRFPRDPTHRKFLWLSDFSSWTFLAHSLLRTSAPFPSPSSLL